MIRSWMHTISIFILLFGWAKIEAEWPGGYYGLPRALSGCPGGAGISWKLGWRFQDTEDKNPSNGRSASLHIDGMVKPSSVNRSFCMKTSLKGDYARPYWPSGRYCIYKRGRYCPSGMTSGYVYWHDEQYDNRNKLKGYLPRGDYQWAVTQIYYCCSIYGNRATPISLPTGSPLYLFSYGSAVCQQVRWAEVTSEWISYDTDDGSFNQDDVMAPYPYGARGTGEGHRIYYCYYTSCNHTLREPTGSFQSPKFPHRYPDGQLCSWRITGNDTNPVTLHFTNFSLNGTTDSVKVYDGVNETSTLIGSFVGSSIPRDITSTAHALFVIFQSDGLRSSSGFRAEYKILEPSTAKPSTTRATTIRSTLSPSQEFKSSSSPDVSSMTNTQTSSITEGFLSTSPTGHTNSSAQDAIKTACAVGGSSPNTVLIVIPLVCMIVVLAVAAYMLYNWRKLKTNKGNEASVRYAPDIDNPSYLHGEVIMAENHDHGRETAENPYGDGPGAEIYQEIQTVTQSTENPLYDQGMDPGKQGKPPATGTHLYDSLA